MKLKSSRSSTGVIAAIAIVLWGPLILSPRATAWAQEQPIAPETNPPGDIPDSQVFITYTSPLGFSLKVPEGWARSDRADGAQFVDKYDSIDLSAITASSAPTVKTVRANEAVALVKTGRAVKITSIKSMKLPAGNVVLIAYTSNSEPNTVTGKQIRLDNNRYLFFSNAGQLVSLDLSAPVGADNVDQWKLMSESFHWN
jgi:hypothetical protein